MQSLVRGLSENNFILSNFSFCLDDTALVHWRVLWFIRNTDVLSFRHLFKIRVVNESHPVFDYL